MLTLIDRLLLLALSLVVVVLAVTAGPALWDAHLSGNRLMLHMAASGGFVVGTPLVALWFLGRVITRGQSTRLQRVGFWVTVSAAVVTISTVFLCMLPLPSTTQMQQLMEVHGYAGFAMVPAVALLVIGTRRARRIQSTRSATPG